jgi:hypothetical protein
MKYPHAWMQYPKARMLPPHLMRHVLGMTHTVAARGSSRSLLSGRKSKEVGRWLAFAASDKGSLQKHEFVRWNPAASLPIANCRRTNTKNGRRGRRASKNFNDGVDGGEHAVGIFTLRELVKFSQQGDFTGREPGSRSAMPRNQRDIAYRLELTRIALGVSAAELCKNVSIGANQWSQYVDPVGDRRVTVDAVYRLKDEYGITFEWIYDGDRSRLPSDLLEKIRAVERLGAVDLSRARGRKKPPRPDGSHSRNVK